MGFLYAAALAFLAAVCFALGGSTGMAFMWLALGCLWLTIGTTQDRGDR